MWHTQNRQVRHRLQQTDWRRSCALQYAIEDLATDATINPPTFSMTKVILMCSLRANRRKLFRFHQLLPDLNHRKSI